MIHRWRMKASIQSYLDGELSEPSRAALAAHLERCQECAAAARRLGETDRLLEAVRPMPPVLPSAATRALLDRALAEAGVSRGGPGRGPSLLAWGLACSLLVLTSGAAAWWWRPELTTGDDRRAKGNHSWPDGVVTAAALPSGASADPRSISAGKRSTPRPPKRPTGEPSAERHPAIPRPPGPRPAPGDARPAAPPAGSGSGERPRRSLPPRYRVAIGPRPSLCELPSAAWWRKLTADVEASETSTHALDQELLVRQTAADDPEAHGMDAVSLAQFPSGLDPTVDMAGGSGSTGEAVDPDPVDEIPPLPAGDGPQPSGEPGETPFLAVDPLPAPPPGRLLVMVTTDPAPSPVAVAEAPDSTPGFARTVALRPDAMGGATWTQATVTDEGIQLALVVLGDPQTW